MQYDDRDKIRKTISEYREAIFAAMLNKHYTHAALYMKCMIACVPSKLKLEAIETPEANLMSNENATDYSKRLFKWIVVLYLQLSVRWQMPIDFDTARRAQHSNIPLLCLSSISKISSYSSIS